MPRGLGLEITLMGKPSQMILMILAASWAHLGGHQLHLPLPGGGANTKPQTYMIQARRLLFHLPPMLMSFPCGYYRLGGWGDAAFPVGFFREVKKNRLIGCIDPPSPVWSGGGAMQPTSPRRPRKHPWSGVSWAGLLARVEGILGGIACIGTRHRPKVPAYPALLVWALVGSQGCSLCGASSSNATLGLASGAADYWWSWWLAWAADNQRHRPGVPSFGSRGWRGLGGHRVAEPI